MEIYLHIGVPKTGSTTIQKFLYKHQEILFKNYSILYPETGIMGVGHHEFPLSLMPKIAKGFGKKINSNTLKEAFLRELSVKKPKITILSSEMFFNLTKENIYEFKRIYKLPINKIICYIRRPDMTIESLYKQTVKSQRLKNKQLFQDYLSRNWRFLDYYNLLSNWKQVFPEAKLIVRIYDRKLFPEGNVALDFLSVLGIDMPEAREYKIEANPSLSHLSALVMRRINEEFNLSNEDHQKIVDYLLKLDKEEGSLIKTFFTLKERIEFLERFRESNEKLFRKYFGTKNQFVLSVEEIEFYKEQDGIPREVVEKAVEERYRKVLEFMKANGILVRERLFPIVQVNYLPNNLEFFRIDILNANLLNGKITISGLALPKADVEDLKLTLKDAGGIKEAQWGLPSPALGEQRKDNPKAKKARFRVDGIVVKDDRPIEVFVNGKKVAEIIIKKTNSLSIEEG